MSAAAVGLRSYQRTNQPVRCESLDVDDPRAQVFRPIVGGIAFVEEYLDAFTQWSNQIKVAGARHELSQNCRRVLEVILRNCADFVSGACEPCLDTLQAKTRFARPTIVRAIKLLQKHKWLFKLRRTERTGNRPDEGPAVRQVSNAYWLDLAALPKRVQMHLAARMRKKGKPLTIAREPRQAIFAGRYKARAAEERKSRAERWKNADDRTRAMMLHPHDPEGQNAYLAMVQTASSQSGLNPPSPLLSGKGIGSQGRPNA